VDQLGHWDHPGLLVQQGSLAQSDLLEILLEQREHQEFRELLALKDSVVHLAQLGQ